MEKMPRLTQNPGESREDFVRRRREADEKQRLEQQAQLKGIFQEHEKRAVEASDARAAELQETREKLRQSGQALEDFNKLRRKLTDL